MQVNVIYDKPHIKLLNSTGYYTYHQV